MEKIILKYALQNAVKYGGKANIGAVIGKIIAEDPSSKDNIKQLVPTINKVIKEVNALGKEKQLKKLQEIAPELLEEKEHKERGLSELPNAKKGGVVLRLAPFPSGPLHIGNARPAIINDEYAKKYNGKLLLVIDDTIGSEEKMIVKEAYDLIIEGLKWLKVDYDKIYYKSDRLEIYYKYAEELIKKDKAYVCFCSADELRDNRLKKKESEHRRKSISENLKNWKDMIKGSYKEGKAVLRIKTSMQDKNPAFRDRVLFRISNREHPRVKNKYPVWPLLEFSWAIDDHLLGITHVIRGKELMIESDMEKFIWDIFGWKHAELIHMGLLQLEGVKISKSKSSKEVKSGIYFGWDDPRTFSLQSLKRRGIQPEAIRQFCLGFGLTQAEIMAPIDSLYAENKKLIDATSYRYFFVGNPKKIKIEKAPQREVELDLHPDNKKGGRLFSVNDDFYITEDDYNKFENNRLYRLMDCLNFIKKKDMFVFDSLEYEKYKDKGTRIVHWLPTKDVLEVEVLMPDASVVKGFGEKNLEKVKAGDTIQLERFGFCRLDKKEKNKLVFWFTHK